MFFQQLDQFGDAVALIQGDRQVTYRQLEQRVVACTQRLPREGVAFLFGTNSVETLVAYLACLRSQLPALLLDPNTHAAACDVLKSAFSPVVEIREAVINPTGMEGTYPLDKRLALLLSTSGSTGTPKQVCLSYRNLQGNAESICAYLPINNTDVTVTTLPFYYSYGLSVVNTHLLKGACIVLSDDSVVSRGFWQTLDAHQVTSLAGVPATYELLLKLRVTQKTLPNIKYLTQAGGKLEAGAVKAMSDYCQKQQKAFYLMYGQTEATARMGYLQPDKAGQKVDAIGRAIPGGEFALLDADGAVIDADGHEGELVYRGPNVMLGYAEGCSDLADFSPISELRTGDMAVRDADGDYRITGRLKRFIKPLGKRINLDDIEKWFRNKGLEAKATGDDNKLLVGVKLATNNNNDSKDLASVLADFLQIHPSLICIRPLSEFPMTATGKTDYPALQQALVRTLP